MASYVAGDQASFEALYRRLSPWLLRLMELQLPQRDLAADLVQQAFLQLHLARRDFRPDAKLRPFLVTIALNLKRSYFRTRGRRREQALTDHMEEADPAGGPEQAAEARRLRRAVGQIPAAEREVLVLHYFGGFSYAEIEQLTGVRRSAIKQRARRGYAHLRGRLEG